MNRNADIPDQPMDLMNCQPNKQEMLCQPPISLLSFLDYYLGIIFFLSATLVYCIAAAGYAATLASQVKEL